MTTYAYNIEPSVVLHNASLNDPFNFAKSSKITPLWIPGQNHTRVPNILASQKLAFLDDSLFTFKTRAETKADKEGRHVDVSKHA